MRKVNIVFFVLALAHALNAAEWDPERQVVPYYRHCNYGWKDHFFTANKGESDSVISDGWQLEGISCYVHKDQLGETKRMRFETAVAESRFSDAYGMVGDTEHGLLAKRLVMAQSKKHLKQLIGASVFEGSVAKLEEARTLVATFPAAPQAELNAFITAEEAAARATLAALTPDAAARTAALRSVADRLFG